MTVKELRRVYTLNQELIEWEEKLESIIAAAQPKAQPITGMPRGNKTSDPTASAAMNGEEALDMIAELTAKLTLEKLKIKRFIATINDPFMQEVIELRNIQLKTWKQIALRIGGTDRAIQKAYYRFFEQKT